MPESYAALSGGPGIQPHPDQQAAAHLPGPIPVDGAAARDGRNARNPRRAHVQRPTHLPPIARPRTITSRAGLSRSAGLPDTRRSEYRRRQSSTRRLSPRVARLRSPHRAHMQDRWHRPSHPAWTSLLRAARVGRTEREPRNPCGVSTYAVSTGNLHPRAISDQHRVHSCAAMRVARSGEPVHT